MRPGIVVIALSAVVAAAVVAAMPLLAERGDPGRTAAVAAVGPQPDTGSPDWRYLGDDVGIMLREDAGETMRGRLYVRVDGLWRPLVLEENWRVIPAR